ncbi:hypothetical protein BDN72DRAFT_839986 [Pluteus cervinus]|uniref:Uncharacterized protein n=1 Tax=Pluteus cervinus TaxID=181527 RepID=A0ACD3AWK2_9AGAR|nr:hypothetical protein BDN72DRAFT_839986 [Pluteus cervinus]
MPTPDNPQLSRQRIDEEIAELKTRIITLKSFRNTFSPLARLHREIIQEIFVIFSQNPARGSIGRAALLLTWVCQSWRELAHETSELWSYIDYVSVPRLQVALPRTRTRPLTFSASFRPGHCDHLGLFPFLCLGNISRIRSLTICFLSGSSTNTLTFKSPLWATPAPLLVALELRDLSFPPDLFSGTFPALRKLCLARCEFSWDRLPIHGRIEDLSISDPIARNAAEDLLRTLQIMGPEVKRLF